MRVLGSVRLSRTTDTTTSPARQREVITTWCHGHAALESGERVDPVAIVVDLDVSGGESPFKRKGLGPWLSEPDKIDQWDVLVVWKLDRLSRSALDTLTILEWAQKRGKRIVAVADGLDTATQLGQMWIKLAAIFAEVERANIRERVSAARAHMREKGMFAGGRVPFGYASIRTENGLRLVERPEHADILREAAALILQGYGLRTVCREFNDRGVPGPGAALKKQDPDKAAIWYPSTLRSVLLTPAVRGWGVHGSEIIRDADGVPIQFGPEILNAGVWELLRETIEERREQAEAVPKTRTNSFWLSGVLFCQCGSLLTRKPNRKTWSYVCTRYQHTSADRCRLVSGINMDQVDEYTVSKFLELLGGFQLTEAKIEGGNDDPGPKLRENKESLERLDKAYLVGVYGDDVDTYKTMRAGIRSRIRELEKQKHEPPRVVYHKLDRTVKEEWDATDRAGQRQMMMSYGFKVIAGPTRFKNDREVVGRLTWDMQPLSPEQLAKQGHDEAAPEWD